MRGMLRSRSPRGPGAGRTVAWFVALALLSVVLILASATEPVLTAQRAARQAVDPLRQLTADAARTAVAAIGAIGDVGRLRDENERLRAALAEAEQRIVALREAERENDQLRELLRVGEALDMDLLPVRVVGRNPSNLVWEIRIDAGRRDGVEAGMPVVAGIDAAGALVGTVIEVDEDASRVQLIVDENSVVIGADQETRALGEVRGQPGGQLVMVNVPMTDSIGPGATIVTAGLTFEDETSRYPGGLLIGRVHTVEPDANGVTQTVYARPAVDPRSLERLLVVLGFQQE